MQYSLNYSVQGFCPLNVKIAQFPGGFRLKLFSLFSEKNLQKLLGE